MIYNKLSGSSIKANPALLFHQFEREQCFVGFARTDETWGTCALVNISLPSSLSDILPTDNNVTGRFVDKKSNMYTNSTDTVVRIYATADTVGDFPIDMNAYESIKDQNLVATSIQLMYINESWCVLKNLPSNYRDILSVDNNQKYYIFAQQANDVYPEHPNADTKMVKINVKSIMDYSTYNEPVNMMLRVAGTEDDIPCFPEAGITRSVSLLGEVSYNGLADKVFESINLTDFQNYFAENPEENGTHTYFYFVNTNNVKVSENLYLQPYINAEGEKSIFHYDGDGNDRKYLLFKSFHQYKVGSQTERKPYYVKLSYNSPPTELAIYHESLPFIYPSVNSVNNISDANPPGLELTYLNNHAIHNSIFDVKGYVKIQKNLNTVGDSSLFSKVSYVKEISSSTEKQRFLAMKFVDNNLNSKRFDTIEMRSDEAVERYANIKPKPNGAPYEVADKRIYLWSMNILVDDNLTIRPTMSDPQSTITRTVQAVDYEEGYVILTESLGVQVIPTLDNAELSNDSQIVTDLNYLVNKIEYAVCDNLRDALSTGMDSVMIELKIPATGSDLYDGIYRQLVVCCDPKYKDANNEIKDCISGSNFRDVEGVSNLFVNETNSWETGTVLYVANKTPVYRKYIGAREYIKLII